MTEDTAARRTIGYIALVVREYDEAISFYCNKAGFRLDEDTDLGGEKRWVRMSPPNSSGTQLLLARAVTPEQSSGVGDQARGRVFLFLDTDDFWRDYRELSARGVLFRRPPSEEPYGVVAMFEDPYGNLWDLLQLK
jgi:catechol 2,3-dioxygenase-like lactoylglutathione lyase family enzyme